MRKTEAKPVLTDEQVEARVKLALRDVGIEVLLAMALHQPFNSRHEGYAVILEELDELWEQVRQRTVDPRRSRREAVQVAAMAIRFLVDCEQGE